MAVATSPPRTSRGPAEERPLGVVPWALAVLALVLGLLWNGRESLWLDEAFSVRIASLAWPAFADELTSSQANMSAYFVLLRGWVQLGTDEATVRALSALAAAATVPCVYALGRRVLGAREAALAALLVAINPAYVTFAQEARSYTLVTLLVTLATVLLVRYVERSTAARALAYAVVMALAVYAHLFALFVLAAHAAALGLRAWRQRRFPRAAGICVGLVGVLLVPLGVYALTGETGHLSWVERPGLRQLGGALVELVGGSHALAAAFAAAGAAGAGRLLFGRERAAPWQAWCLLGWLALPVLGSFAVSLAVKPVFIPRYLVLALPAWALLCAAGIGLLRDGRVRTAAALALVVLSAAGLPAVYRDRVNTDWRATAALLAARAQPGDSVVVYAPFARTALDYYAAEQPRLRRRARPLFPPSPWGRFDLQRQQQAVPDPAAVAARAGPRVWLITAHVPDPTVEDRLRQALATGRHATTTSLTGVDVTLFAATD